MLLFTVSKKGKSALLLREQQEDAKHRCFLRAAQRFDDDVPTGCMCISLESNDVLIGFFISNTRRFKRVLLGFFRSGWGHLLVGFGTESKNDHLDVY